VNTYTTYLKTTGLDPPLTNIYTTRKSCSHNSRA